MKRARKDFFLVLLFLLSAFAFGFVVFFPLFLLKQHYDPAESPAGLVILAVAWVALVVSVSRDLYRQWAL